MLFWKADCKQSSIADGVFCMPIPFPMFCITKHLYCIFFEWYLIDFDLFRIFFSNVCTLGLVWGNFLRMILFVLSCSLSHLVTFKCLLREDALKGFYYINSACLGG